jgi:hypothetical protein
MHQWSLLPGALQIRNDILYIYIHTHTHTYARTQKHMPVSRSKASLKEGITRSLTFVNTEDWWSAYTHSSKRGWKCCHLLWSIPLSDLMSYSINPLNTELNPICHFLALLGTHHILHVSRVRVKPISERKFLFSRVKYLFKPFIHLSPLAIFSY